MTDEVGPQLAVGKLPHLHQLVPATGDDQRVGGVRGEGHAGDPLGVALAIGLDGVLALAQGVPELDGLVAGAGDDLTVVSGECHGEDILVVTDEAAGGQTSVQVPEAEGAIPRAGQCELAVGGDHHVLDEVAVAAEGLLRVAVCALLADELPHHHGLVAGSGQDHVGVLVGGGDCRHPVGVALKDATHCKVALFGSHGRTKDFCNGTRS